LITLTFVPGGPDPMTNGLLNFKPSTVVASVLIADEVVAIKNPAKLESCRKREINLQMATV
jgi:hypothetical protein